MSTDLNPLSVLARLSPYLAGSATVTVYSQHQQVLAELLQYCKHDAHFLNPNLTESFTRTYQVLPGRTHPLMTTSATGGYLLHALKVIPSKAETNAYQYDRQKRAGAAKKKKQAKSARSDGSSADAAAAAEGLVEEDAAAGAATREGTADEDVDEML